MFGPTSEYLYQAQKNPEHDPRVTDWFGISYFLSSFISPFPFYFFTPSFKSDDFL
jgi:hypothetical protein